ncbi:MAG: 5'/3'-nucleotidase SurE [Chloroflexota bacterium]
MLFYSSSASGHPKTMHRTLRVDEFEWPDGSTAYKSDGAPPDCVALAFLGILDKRPDLVVSGINLGSNLGYDVFYSGTVAAAVEAAIDNVPAIAFSRMYPFETDDFTLHSKFAAKLAASVLEHGLPADMILNVNFPMASWDKIQGVHITRLGRRIYIDELIKRKDPKGKNYYWIGGEPSDTVVNEPGTDVWAIENNYISITPLGLDWTAHRMIEDIKRWHLEDLWKATNNDTSLKGRT